ncbi:hypothetical protein [Moorena sp. SIO3I6]|uniref:hypothetical protein n=1 Tax=Moorena sp. SIO3I6 TaxID=2607831 RepID=UPI0013FB46F5|nr:hypothetical protein [Moorena sp. SIO3I6]NEP24701.1 hypothetical protein [Moorena sp. SIO3I6]
MIILTPYFLLPVAFDIEDFCLLIRWVCSAFAIRIPKENRSRGVPIRNGFAIDDYDCFTNDYREDITNPDQKNLIKSKIIALLPIPYSLLPKGICDKI